MEETYNSSAGWIALFVLFLPVGLTILFSSWLVDVIDRHATEKQIRRMVE